MTFISDQPRKWNGDPDKNVLAGMGPRVRRSHSFTDIVPYCEAAGLSLA